MLLGPPRISCQLEIPSTSVPVVQSMATIGVLTVPKKIQPFMAVGVVLGGVQSPSGTAAVGAGCWALP